MEVNALFVSGKTIKPAARAFADFLLRELRHVEKLAREIAAGARQTGASADVKRVPELLSLEATEAANYKLDHTTSLSTTRSS
jgi:hypothetical protein